MSGAAESGGERSAQLPTSARRTDPDVSTTEPTTAGRPPSDPPERRPAQQSDREQKERAEGDGEVRDPCGHQRGDAGEQSERRPNDGRQPLDPVEHERRVDVPPGREDPGQRDRVGGDDTPETETGSR